MRNHGITDDKYNLALRFDSKSEELIRKDQNCTVHQQSQCQDKYGFIPLGELMLPDTPIENLPPRDILTAHTCIKNSWKFNFMDAQILVVSQLYLAVWDNYLAGYWDNQLPILIRHGFPLEFCCDSPLRWEGKNHTSGAGGSSPPPPPPPRHNLTFSKR